MEIGFVGIKTQMGQTNHMMKNLNAIIALASSMCVLGSNYYETPYMDEKMFNDFLIEK